MGTFNLEKYGEEIAGFMRKGDFVETPEGVLIHDCIIGTGFYDTTVNGKDRRVDFNLIPAASLNMILDVMFGSAPKLSNWYLAVFAGAVNPASNWTAANFAANASEITSNTEGYSNVTRPAWVPSAAASGGIITNVPNRAVFNIVCTSTLNISGAAVLSDNAKGGVDGLLASAARYEAVRVVNNGDAFEVGYGIKLRDS